MNLKRTRPFPHRGLSMAALSIALITCAAIDAAAEVRDVSGARFEERVQIGEQELELHAASLFRYLVFDVYVAGLYLEAGRSAAALLEEEAAVRFDIFYLREFTVDDFRKSTRAGIEKNVPAQVFEQLQPKIDRFSSFYRPVRAGDRYQVRVSAEGVTELRLNDEPLGEVEGFDFAHAYLGIWFGPEPFSESLRETLLEGE